MEYAPIIIPTLNRYEHLKRCLDSLSKCTHSEKTDIYISVDYPPSEKYFEGYKKVCQLLEEYDFSSFNCKYVFIQKDNLGPGNNIDYLQEKVNSVTDKVILTEDDNEFSPNFLDYINTGFEVFDDDPSVLSICANKDTDWFLGTSNVTKVKISSPYGIGEWLSKTSKFQNACNEMMDNRKAWSIRNLLKLYINNPRLYSIFVIAILCRTSGLYWKTNGKLRFVDTVRSIFMHLTDYVCIVPTLSLSRTFGNDGSGVNMAAREDNGTQEIDTKNTFEIGNLDEVRFYKANYTTGRKYMGLGYFSKPALHAHLLVLLLKLCGNKRERLLKLLNKQ